MVTGNTIIEVASKEIGTHEGPGKTTKYGKWFGLQGKPWCMEFVQWVYFTACFNLPYKTASCGELLRWYKKNDPECVTNNPSPGCIVIFDWPRTKYDTDHTGIFVAKSTNSITTIDGNTSNGNDSNGGWVQRRTRSLSYANPIYIIPRGLVTEPPEEEEEEMRYNTIEDLRNAKMDWAIPTIEKMIKKNLLNGTGAGFDLSSDMIRIFVINDRSGVYGV